MKKYSILIALLLVLGFGFYQLSSSDLFTRTKAQHVAEAYYSNLAKGDIETAFDYVGYFDKAPNLPPALSYEEAKRIWVSRVKKLREQGTYLKDAKEIRVFINDDYPVGEAEVTTVTNGRIETVTEKIYFSKLNGKWKVQRANRHIFGEPSILEIARSGRIAFKNINPPEKIIVYRNGKQKTLTKFDFLFNDILTLTDERFIGGAHSTKGLLSLTAIKEMRENGFAVEFIYSESQSMEIDNNKGKIDYYGLFFPLTDDSQRLIDSETFAYQTQRNSDYMGYRGPLGLLQKPDKLIEMINQTLNFF